MDHFAVAIEDVNDVDEPDPDYWIEFYSADNEAHVREQVKNAYPEDTVSILAIRKVSNG